nr:DUF2029 domain-containing protein [Chloroflexota bacterium]
MGTLTHQLAQVRLLLEAVEVQLHAIARSSVGLRLLDRIGWTRMLRLAMVGWWSVIVVASGTVFRPDLIHPTDLGSDTSNYIAAAERVAAGHDVYSLQPGDRPVPLDNPPDWTVPLLSPPTMAVGSNWTVAIPDGWRLYPMWAIGLGGTAAAGFLVAAFAPPLLLLVATQFWWGLGITAWSGNVNALIVPAMVVVWWGMRSRRVWAERLAGILTALAAGLKIGPLVVAVWLLAQRRRQAAIAMIATGLGLGVATLILVGPGSAFRWLDIARATAAVSSDLSLPRILERAGVPGSLAALAIPVD